jgi:hypothetical protein
MTSCRVAWALLIAVLAGAGLLAQSAQNAQPQALTLRMIVVSTNDEAIAVLDRLKRGETFATVARGISIDPSARTAVCSTRDVASLRDQCVAPRRGYGPASSRQSRRPPASLCSVVSEAPGTHGAEPGELRGQRRGQREAVLISAAFLRPKCCCASSPRPTPGTGSAGHLPARQIPRRRHHALRELAPAAAELRRDARHSS